MGKGRLLLLAAMVTLTNSGVTWAEERELPEEEAVIMDEVSVTATRTERGTKEVPAAITVVGKETIEQSRMFNVKDAISGTPGLLIESKNGGYDARLIIRGAGQKARYGVREITVLRDGVPMTDPDSFTRLDFIDSQDIERVEVTKGPGSIYGGGSAGGVIQILSKSVFDMENRIKIGYGSDNTQNLHARISTQPNDKNAVALTVSHRAMDNSWRRWNKFDTQQMSIKHGLSLDSGAVIESEISFAQADMQLPGTMDDGQFDTYKQTGRQKETGDPWKHSGRYSEIWFVNSRLEKEWEDFSIKPRAYFTHWSHYHPVTGAINDSPENMVYGVDLEVGYSHNFLGNSHLMAGITLRQDRSNDAKKYKYKDITTEFIAWPAPGHDEITSTLSDEKGDLLSTEDSTNTLLGIYALETLRPWERLTVDIGLRYDRSLFEIETNEDEQYDYSNTNYTTGDGYFITRTKFHLPSANLGASLKVTDNFNIFGSVAQSEQVPSSSEIKTNSALGSATNRSMEFGIKGRGESWSIDTSVYKTWIEDEIVSVLDSNDETTYQNAGESIKTGFELEASVTLFSLLKMGGGYAYSDYRFIEFTEYSQGLTLVHDSHRHPYVPRNQYSLFAEFSHDSGLKARINTTSWGPYYLDNANTEKYNGYEFITNAMVSYQYKGHLFSLSGQNITNEYYATEVKKSARGTRSYAAGAPQSLLATYTYNF